MLSTLTASKGNDSASPALLNFRDHRRCLPMPRQKAGVAGDVFVGVLDPIGVCGSDDRPDVIQVVALGVVPAIVVDELRHRCPPQSLLCGTYGTHAAGFPSTLTASQFVHASFAGAKLHGARISNPTVDPRPPIPATFASQPVIQAHTGRPAGEISRGGFA